MSYLFVGILGMSRVGTMSVLAFKLKIKDKLCGLIPMNININRNVNTSTITVVH
jgi:hypothetical protein